MLRVPKLASFNVSDQHTLHFAHFLLFDDLYGLEEKGRTKFNALK